MDKIIEINKALDRCCELALKQPLPNKQIALMTDASFSSAAYAVPIEDDPLEKYAASTRKAFAAVAYGSKTFSPTQLKMSISRTDSWQFSLLSRISDIYFGEPRNLQTKTYRQQIRDTIFSGQNHSANTLKRM